MRGTGGSGPGKRVRIARARVREWSPRVEDRFLSVLAATCNVKAACAAVGLTATSAYEHRKRWPSFARRWSAAVEEGMARLDIGLLEAARNLLAEPERPDADETALTGMTVAQAIHLVHMHKHRVHGIGRAPGLRGAEPPIEAVRATVLRKVAAVERATAIAPAVRAADRRAWAARRGGRDRGAG